MRLSAAWTPADRKIIARLLMDSGRLWGHLVAVNRAADTRDAELMRIGVSNPWCVLTYHRGRPDTAVLLRGAPMR